MLNCCGKISVPHFRAHGPQPPNVTKDWKRPKGLRTPRSATGSLAMDGPSTYLNVAMKMLEIALLGPDQSSCKIGRGLMVIILTQLSGLW